MGKRFVGGTMADAPQNYPIATVRKGRGSEVRIALGVIHGARVVDLRTYMAFDDSGAPKATRKGVNLDVLRLREVREALEAAESKAREMGWLSAEESAAHG